MKEPTQEQSKEFWERCGFNFAGDKRFLGFPDGTLRSITGVPPIDLNNLFKWAVPQLVESLGEYKAWKILHAWLYKVINQRLWDKEAVALFWVLK